ncbi:uncharacterized protein TrAFT101_010438 [Trichoderma asperellum]|uniref:uncharacterized protein n=1 Tax=Trichoderma asperellum TaxID=101201 RepID=UPI0033222535|nr:hypothetical protein TrAFT101_010438 [Trichoderma asperellum]
MRRPPSRRRLIAAPPLQLKARLPLRAAAQLMLLLLLRSALVLPVLLVDAMDLLLTSSISRDDVCDGGLRRRRSLVHAERAIHVVLRNDVSRLSQRSNARWSNIRGV